MRKVCNLLAVMAIMLAPACANAQKYVGGDISLLTKYEEHGAEYLDNSGNAISGDMLEYLKNQGLNAMRVRLFVDPSKATTDEQGEGVCQDIDYVVKLGKRIKDAGFKLMIDFHYSDSWADPAKQWTPDAWTGLSDDDLYTKIYDYTKEALTLLKDGGAEPDFIQTGNEISYGMCWGKKNTTSPRKYYSTSGTNADYFTSLLKNAGKACREICPNAAIVLHTERIAQTSVLTAFYKQMDTSGVDYDIIGTSYYPYYHGSLSVLDDGLTTLETTFPDKKIMVVETGYYNEWQPSDVTYDFSSTYPITDAGQKAFTQDLIKTLNGHKSVNGMFWWFMEANEHGLDWNTQRVTDSWYNAGLWNNTTGKAQSALYILKDFLEGQDGIVGINAGQTGADGAWHTIDGTRISAPTRPGIYLHGGKKVAVSK